jgi:hypothetical protein
MDAGVAVAAVGGICAGWHGFTMGPGDAVVWSGRCFLSVVMVGEIDTTEEELPEKLVHKE